MTTTWVSVRDLNVPELRSDQPLLDRITELTAAALPAGQPNKLSSFTVYQRQQRLNASMSVSVAPFFKGDGSYSDFKYRYFAGGFSNRIRTTSGNNNDIIAERFGLGIELELNVSQLQTSIKGGFGMIAAAVEMQLATVDYTYHIYAFPTGDFYTALPPMGKFDDQVLGQFKALVDKVKTAYQQQATQIDLVAIEVLLATPVKDEGTQFARSYYFAGKQILKGQSLKAAIQEARIRTGYNEDAIQYIYSRVGLRSIDDTPSTQNQDITKSLLNL